MSRRTSGRLLACAAAIMTLAAGAESARSQILTTGFNSDPVLTTGTLSARAPWITRAVALGTNLMRVNYDWRNIAPPNPGPNFVASDPATYSSSAWAPLDTTIRSLTAAGFRVMITLGRAPDWAEGPGRPASAYGTWKPNPNDFAQFATAITTRYSGHYPDPLNPGGFLPAVRLWQPWNEPNLTNYLAPQWQKTSSGYVPVSPDLYRPLQNAFYRAAKAVSKSNTVFMAGTAPFGDPAGGLGMRPLYFERHLFCLNNHLEGLRTCPGKIYLDGMDNHPYEDFGPTHAAVDPDDATMPDMWKITRVTRAGVRTGRILPRGNKPVWATEFSWDTNPPDPHGISLATQAKYVEQAFYILWKQGIYTTMCFLIADRPPIPSFAGTYQAGLYFIDGRPKPVATAVRFPFVTSRQSKSRVFIWGRAPATGTLAVQQVAAHGKVRTLQRLRVVKDNVFTATVSIRGAAGLRAQMPRYTSLVWNQGG